MGLLNNLYKLTFELRLDSVLFDNPPRKSLVIKISEAISLLSFGTNGNRNVKQRGVMIYKEILKGRMGKYEALLLR